MSKKFIYVFSIKTIPNLEPLRAQFELEMDECKASLQALELNEDTLSFAHHKTICLSIALLDEFGKFLKLTTIEASTPRQIAQEFFASLNKYNPKIISFGGKSFDMNLMLLEAMRHNINASGYLNKENKWSNYLYGDDWHMDLAQVFAYAKGKSLDNICQALHIPSSHEINLTQCINLYYANKLDMIKEYSLCDTLRILFLFYKFEFAKRDLYIDDYVQNLFLIKEFLQSQEKRPYQDDFINYCHQEIKNLKNAR